MKILQDPCASNLHSTAEVGFYTGAVFNSSSIIYSVAKSQFFRSISNLFGSGSSESYENKRGSGVEGI